MFGHEFKKDFLIDENIVNVNSGAFSPVHRDIFELSNNIRQEKMANFEQFKVDMIPMLQQSRTALGNFINANPDDIVFTSSATESLNSVLRSIILFAGEEIVVDASIYPSTMRILEFICGRAGARLRTIDIPASAGISQIVDKYNLALSNRTRLLVIEDVRASDGIDNPLEQILPLYKERGVEIVVDGSHALGMKDVDVKDLDVDWYLGCTHKWGMSFKGVGYIITQPHQQPIMRSMRISQNHDKEYLQRFAWLGTSDYSAWFTVEAGLEKLQSYGLENVRGYCEELVINGATKMAEELGVNYFVPEAQSTFMTVLELPAELQDKKISAQQIQHSLLQKGVNAKIVVICNKKYIRLSAFIINELDDYKKCATAIKQLVQGDLI